MFSLYLVAILATFGAAALIGLAIGLPRLQHLKAVRLLEAQVGGTSSTSVSLREQNMSRSAVERLLFPALQRTSSLTHKITPVGMRERVARKLVLAGSPMEWDAERVLGVKLVGGVGVPGFIFVLATLGGNLGTATLLMVGLLGYVGFFGPDIVLSGRGRKRQTEIRRSLADTMDLLTISVESGLGFDGALSQVVRNVPGSLSQEIARTMQEMQLGISRSNAFRNLAARTDVDELKGFTLALIQADVFGISIAQVLRNQSKEMRTKRRQRAEETAMKLPVKLLFPLILCILPALFVVIIGPGVIRLMENFF